MFFLIFGLILCLVSTYIFITLRVKKGQTAGVLSKTVASFCFIAFAFMLQANKSGLNQQSSLAITFILLGLICGLIGDILLDLKVMYSFHKDQYLTGGMIAFSLGHIFYITSLFLVSYPYQDVLKYHLLDIFLITLSSIVLMILIWIFSKKVAKLEFGKFTGLVNLYSFILIFTTILSIYLSFIITEIPMYILAIGFVLFLLSDLILSLQYFGNKEQNKVMIVLNHTLYYMAQIIIAMFIYFI